MTDETTSTPVPVNSNIAAGISLIESAIEFFETVEGDKHPVIAEILNIALMVAKMI